MPQKINCPCGSSSRHTTFTYNEPPLGETAFDIGNQSYTRSYECCDYCGHYSSVTEMDLGFIYDGAYVNQTYGDRMGQIFNRIIALPPEKSDNEGRAQYLLSQAQNHFNDGQKISLLDIGSGLSVFPWRMKKEGWDITALDPDERAARHAKEVVGVKSIAADFLELNANDCGTFDIITLNKVLEHVEKPAEMLEKVQDFLKPNGFVYIELPDVAAAVDGKGREEFFIEHHHIFSIASMSIMAEKAGFKVERIERLIEPSTKYTLRGILKL
ncbi:class I SAM-dependent methyltransferase [Kiloniella majae]|uniref:class I SAM-dependent methyltransferase n=1 Tax=Kiloniella majae TaxID=1938558 RepID=UPI000A27995B|nr:class I SAM-dependent methyltransferase [Kiloniella majae]